MAVQMTNKPSIVAMYPAFVDRADIPYPDYSLLATKLTARGASTG